VQLRVLNPIKVLHTVHDEARAARNAGSPILLVHVLEALHVGWRSSEQSPNDVVRKALEQILVKPVSAGIDKNPATSIVLLPVIQISAIDHLTPVRKNVGESGGNDAAARRRGVDLSLRKANIISSSVAGRTSIIRGINPARSRLERHHDPAV
jgi:hypothetical protein